MIQVIEDLRERKQKITSNFKRQKNEYRSKINRIDRAISSFEKGFKELQAGELRPPSTADIVESIMLENQKAMHLKEILKELNHRRPGVSFRYQSVSRLLQTHAKRRSRFKRIAPATFALIENEKLTRGR